MRIRTAAIAATLLAAAGLAAPAQAMDLLGVPNYSNAYGFSPYNYYYYFGAPAYYCDRWTEYCYRR